MFTSGMGYRDIASYVEEIYDHKISAAEISSITDKLLTVITTNGAVATAICISNSVHGWYVF
jgi:hypothetical protein